MRIPVLVLRLARPRRAAFTLVAFALAAVGRAQPEVDFKALAQQVQIRRDEWGVPHILAPNEVGAAFGMGYAQAEDYPDLLPRLFTVAKAESAKYFGDSYYNRDYQNKLLRLYDDSVDRFDTLKPNIQGLLNGYAAGYNLWLERFQGKREEWMKPITGAQVLAHGRVVVVLEFTMRLNGFPMIPKATNGAKPQAALEPKREFLEAALRGAETAPDEDMMGSNMWAIGKERTASGRGILLANPHLQWAASMLFYEAHVNIPGLVNLSGSTLIGSPGITIGFNEHLGWSHTVNVFDSHDVYELEDDPARPDHYMYDGLSLPLRKREIVIEVKKADGTMEQRKSTILDSHFGPILGERDGKKCALKSPNVGNLEVLEQWNAMGKARNLKEFKAGLNQTAIPMFNIAYADREGNCFYIYNGRIPARPEGAYDWAGVLPGNTSRDDWSFVHPAYELPQILNPKGGYVQNCNDAPWYTNKQQAIDKTLFPAYMCKDDLKWRSQLSLEMLESESSFTLDKIKKLKFNTKMMGADRMKDGLLAILQNHADAAPEMPQAIELLKGWNNRADWDSRGALLFQTWLIDYQGKSNPTYAKPWSASEPFTTPAGVGDEKAAVETMKGAIASMKETYGRIDPAWGEIHRLKRGEKSFQLAGGTGTMGFFRVISFGNSPKDKAAFPGERFGVGGDSYVMTVEFTEPPTAWSVSAYSETERPESPHFADQSELFARHEFKRAWFTEDDVVAHAKRTYHPGE